LKSNASASSLTSSNSQTSLTSPARNLHNNPPHTPVYEKLYSQASFPLAYRFKFDDNVKDITGEIADDRGKAMKLLQGVSSSEINSVGMGRSADLRNEVSWRLLLRNDDVELSSTGVHHKHNRNH
jgi:hypothetical protein